MTVAGRHTHRMQKYHLRPAGSPPANGYSHAVSFTGRMVVISGQIPLDADGRLVGPDDPPAQIRQVFRNLQVALAAAGASMTDVVKLTVFLTDMSDLNHFRAVRDEFVDGSQPPASTLVQVSRLVDPAWRIEVEALAALPE